MQIIDKIEDKLKYDKKFNIFFDIYSFTNENISGYLPYFDLKNKSLLTVGSSCDQVLNASIEGCDDITICDICPLTKYYFYLKLSSLLTFNKEEYLMFLCQTYYNVEHNPYFLNISYYEKIKETLKSLDYDSFCLWDYLFNNYSSNEIEKIFRKDNNIKSDIINCNNYLKNDKSFKRIKSSIMNTNISFINGNVINEEYDRSFDNIWLSNVAHYLNRKEIRDMFFDSERVLNKNGKMLVCYFWNNIVSDKEFIIKELNDVEIEILKIKGTNSHQDNSIILYKELKKI